MTDVSNIYKIRKNEHFFTHTESSCNYSDCNDISKNFTINSDVFTNRDEVDSVTYT